MTPAGTSNELDVQNEWEENTHTHTHTHTHTQGIVLLVTNGSNDSPLGRLLFYFIAPFLGLKLPYEAHQDSIINIIVAFVIGENFTASTIRQRG